MVYVSSPLSSRNQFGKYLMDLGLSGVAVEIGTHQGDFASLLIRNWKGVLHCIDPWCILAEYKDQAECLPNKAETREEDQEIAISRLSPYYPRVVLIKGLSSEAVSSFQDDSLDFVYIDGDHSRKAVEEDLTLWWPKIHSGGVIAGHDWLCPGETNAGWGQNIQPVVHNFATRHSLTVQLIVEENGLPWSFHITKP